MFSALYAQAALGLYVFVEIFFAVVVGQLFPFFYFAQRGDIDVAAGAIGLAVGRARVVGEARNVGRNIAVTH